MEPARLPPSTTSSYGLLGATWELMQGRLWPLINEILWTGDDTYRPQATFSVIPLGEIVVTTDTILCLFYKERLYEQKKKAFTYYRCSSQNTF